MATYNPDSKVLIELAQDADPASNEPKLVVWDFTSNKIQYVDSETGNVEKELPSPAYKVYTAIMNQSGATPPTVTILENTLGNIVWSYSAAGQYVGTLAGAFPSDKTFITPQYSTVQDAETQIQRANDDEINILTSNEAPFGTFTSSDDVMPRNLSVEIRVYN